MKKIEDMTKEELVDLVKAVKRRKKYGLVWEDKPEDVVEQCKKELPILEEVTDKKINLTKALQTNLLIEGDNFHALSVLNYTHTGKIDVIYIDPPYNTGAKDWKYNNDFVDINDTYRHSKWISMMNNRLSLAKRLLSPDGVLICAIDDNEHAHLGTLLEEVFPNKEIHWITVIHNPGGIQGKNFSYTHEYAVFVIPKGKKIVNLQDRADNPDVRPLRDVSTGDHLRTDAKNCFYPIYVKDNIVVGFGDVCPDSFHPSSANVLRKDGILEIYPIDAQGNERKWVFARQTVEEIKNELKVVFNKQRKIHDIIRTKSKFNYKTVWTDGRYNANAYGTKILRKILPNCNFDFPKSIYTVYDCISAIVANKKDAIILDYFAGSGTTGHAVLMLNKLDEGNRKFILCTNNENGIAEDVCYPRIKKVIDGVVELSDITGFSANLRYFKTAFVSKSKVSDDTRRELVKRSTEMICVRENTFEKIEDNTSFKIYRDSNHVTGVLFDLDSLDSFKKRLQELNLSAHIYVFSLTNDTFNDDFDDLRLEHELCPIPESILEVYRKLFK